MKKMIIQKIVEFNYQDQDVTDIIERLQQLVQENPNHVLVSRQCINYHISGGEDIRTEIEVCREETEQQYQDRLQMEKAYKKKTAHREIKRLEERLQMLKQIVDE